MLPSQPKLKFTGEEAKKPVQQILHPRAARKTSLICAVRTVPAASLAVTKVNNYRGDIFDLLLLNSLPKLLRVVACIKRFIQRIDNPGTKESSDIISSGELTEAMIFLATTKEGFFRQHKNLRDNVSGKCDKQNPKILPVFI